MDLQLFLALNLMSMSLVAALVLVLNRPAGTPGWLAVHAVVIGAGAAALFWLPGWAGVVVAVLFVPLVVAPTACSILAMRSASASRFKAAARYARLAALFHPTPLARFFAATISAQAEDTLENRMAALRALDQHATEEQKVALKVQALRAQDDWPGLLALARTEPHPNADLKVLEIRALGECGQLNEMIETYETAKWPLHGADLAIAQLFVLSFAGRTEPVERLLRSSIRTLDAEAQSYWQAVALRGAGGAELPWRSAMRWLADEAASPTLRLAARRHLTGQPVTASSLGPQSLEALAATETWLSQQPARPKPSLARMPVTLTLIAANLAMFAAEEVYGGSENLRALVDLGAMWPLMIIEDGQWWRLGSSLFLHYGALHLGVNMLLLAMLGRDCELKGGSVQLAVVYLVGGIASSAFVLAMMWNGYTRPAVLVGASGAVFALIGLEVARRILNWTRSRDVLDRRGLVLIGAVLAIQFGMDLSLPQVSLAAHASGLVAGLIIGLAWCFIGRREA